MLLSDFTSFDEVRAVVGLSSSELPDAQLNLAIYTNSLQLSLGYVTLPSPYTGTLETEFETVALLDEDARTASQQMLYNLTRLYATYSVAYEVASSLSMSAPKSQSDGKRTLTRFSDQSTFMQTAGNIASKLGSLRNALNTLGATEVIAKDYLVAIKPAFNVVTNT